jgi:Na+-driven multidrug efflux pump
MDANNCACMLLITWYLHTEKKHTKKFKNDWLRELWIMFNFFMPIFTLNFSHSIYPLVL